ncbi:hypothetical protein PtrSN002B_002018 [Pyrenophora tritici-repentis]|uniref:DUF936 multi-domain protein n=2 Tax=Pyrenophora tritici-repentis TaxID=45151 RepID=A0A2W1I1A5_9PLEO|nr:uncharacterized protein PTRG_05926 [Pyrenophora tritici-repentis Pt-1C-BFP]KAA8619045.1 hypothetical protein PtrV1_08474 [Pyrenophora tritici-repentis]EDU48846.1 predicted protein [Pyrenophora tritici-repentis Pt-1C-BFP]KAF7449510.1 hypothetical protein A1F99_065590 [Pyrenophora tritici-repentis]KAF7570377.1 DUF936 multi-domain protein [Pyrenophora tritici-repentis]KAG9383549.1 hypothetical protein A1F94_005460 [Pyrenophora tritici-repentis]
MKYLNIIPFIVGGSYAVLCASNGPSTAPEPVVNTLDGFKNEKLYTHISKIVRNVPGYEAVITAADCAIASPKYMTYISLKHYNPTACAQACNMHAGCDGFNIYVQREPGVQPSQNCPNPTAIAVTRCALYSEPVTKSQCTNEGQKIGPVDYHNLPFEVAIRGSNAYNKLPVKEKVKVVTVTKYLTEAAIPTSGFLSLGSNTRLITPAKTGTAFPTSTLYGPRVTPHTPDLASNIDSHGRTFSSRTVTATIDGVVRINEARVVEFPEGAPISTDGPFPHVTPSSSQVTTTSSA